VLAVEHHGNVTVVINRHAAAEIVCCSHKTVCFPPMPGSSGSDGAWKIAAQTRIASPEFPSWTLA
jgi:hypothetical protein